jgi:RNA polymerase sigma factor for flagellar operon FliA
MNADRETVIRSFLPLVRRLARRIARLVGGVDCDDLIGDGCIGLIRAVDAFDPARGPSLEQFAKRSILGAMLNGIRRMDPVSERARRIVRDGEHRRYAAAMLSGSIPTTAEIERSCPGFGRALIATHRGQPLSLDAPLPLGERLGIDWGGDPARICERHDRERTFAALIDRLPDRQRRLVIEHYYRGRPLRSIGRGMAISPQRASQLHLAALNAMKKNAHAVAPH